MTSRKALVYEYLERHANEWVDGTEILGWEVGGSEGTRRLRELRADGYNIQKRRHPDPRRTIFQYRLVQDEPSTQVRMFTDL